MTRPPSEPAATTVMQFVSNRYFGCRYHLFIFGTAAGRPGWSFGLV
jgi:hypothetical protein